MARETCPAMSMMPHGLRNRRRGRSAGAGRKAGVVGEKRDFGKKRRLGEDAGTNRTLPAAFSDYSRETVKYRPICLRCGFQRKRPRIKQIGRYLSVYPVPICARAQIGRAS